MTNTTKKTALVTGASSGMGKVIAEQLLKDGMNVVVAARRVEKMENLKTQGAHPLELDVSNEESLLATVDTINGKFGGIDVLVNNAGFGLYGAVEDIPIEKARYQLDVNVFGAARLIQLILPHMREQRSGKIINISSMGGKIYTPLGAWYHASKHALEGFSDCLRLETAPFGIDIVVIEPGFILTAFGEVFSEPLKEMSGNGPYADLVNKLLTGTAESYGSGRGSSPQVVADVVSKAIKTRKPKTRYVAGQYAKLSIFVRKWFGDRVFDRMIMSMM